MRKYVTNEFYEPGERLVDIVSYVAVGASIAFIAGTLLWEKFSQKKDERLESRTEETILSNSEMYRNTIMTKEHWQKNYVVPFNKNSVEKLLIQ